MMCTLSFVNLGVTTDTGVPQVDQQTDQAFATKTAKVVVVEQSSAGRQILCDVVRSLGFQDVQGAALLKDALSILEVETIDWLITPLHAEQAVNALQILKLAPAYECMQNLKVTLFLAKEERSCLPMAFEMGLLSWIEQPFTKTSLLAELAKLLETFAASGWNSTLTAADYLRLHLMQSKLYMPLLRLEESLIETFPGKLELLLKIAEAQFLNNASAAGERSLRQLCLLDPASEARAKALAKFHLGNDTLVRHQSAKGGAINSEPINILGLGTCVVVDPDLAIQMSMSKALEEIGVHKIEMFQDGEAACQWLSENKEPSVIFHEWKIPRLKGPLFVQRVRQLRLYDVAMVVVSSLVAQKDFAIIKEMGVSNIIAKPINRKTLVASLVMLTQQERMPTQQKNFERKIRMALAAGKLEEARRLKDVFLSRYTVSDVIKEHIDAEFAFAEGHYLACRDHAIAALKLAGDTILLLNLLGKAFMQLRDFPNALKCFEKAQALSPMNIARLFDIAEVRSELGDNGKAAALLEEAKLLDPFNKTVSEKQAGCAINAGQLKSAHEIMSRLESVDNIVAYLNNRAVALARCGRPDDSLELYKRSLQALPTKFVYPRVVVHYNLALAYAKRQELREAAEQLTLACRDEHSRIRKKALSLKTRVDYALKHASPLTLKLGYDAQGDELPADEAEKYTYETRKQAAPAKQDVLDALRIRRGDICCYLLFKCGAELRDSVAEKMVESLPHFTPRKAIEREETFGLDKLMSRS